MKTLLNYSYVKATENEGITSCIYRGTEVIRIDENKKLISLNTWWRYSTTTKKYMNRFVPAWIGIFQKNYERFVKLGDRIEKYQANEFEFNEYTVNIIR